MFWFINRWMDKQNVVYTHDGILFSLKKEFNSDTCYYTDELWGHYVKWIKPVTKGQILYDSTYMRYLEKSNSSRQKVEWWGPGGERGEWRVSVIVGTEFQFCKMKRVLEMDSGDGCTKMWIYLMLLNCTLKMVNIVTYILHNKKINNVE